MREIPVIGMAGPFGSLIKPDKKALVPLLLEEVKRMEHGVGGQKAFLPRPGLNWAIKRIRVIQASRDSSLRPGGPQEEKRKSSLKLRSWVPIFQGLWRNSYLVRSGFAMSMMRSIDLRWSLCSGHGNAGRRHSLTKWPARTPPISTWNAVRIGRPWLLPRNTRWDRCEERWCSTKCRPCFNSFRRCACWRIVPRRSFSFWAALRQT